MEIRDTEMTIKAILEYVNAKCEYLSEDRTLKLYDVAFLDEDDIKKAYPNAMSRYFNDNFNDAFECFCTDEYAMFQEDCENNLNIDIYEIMHYIRGTSHFDCCPIEDFKDYGQDGQSQRQLFEYLLETLFGGYTGNFELDNNLKIVEFGNDGGESQDTADYIRNEMMKDVQKMLADSLTIAEYIDTFMAGQVDTFKEWIQCQEWNAQDEAEQETKSAIDSLNETIKGIVEKSAEALKAEKLAELNEQLTALQNQLTALEA